jgi:sialic acid synthase SpsE
MMFEKHFTLDRSLPGPDHAFSADPAAMAAYVGAIREAEDMFGSGGKLPAGCEAGPRLNGRRYLTAMSDLPAGRLLAAGDIRARRIDPARHDPAKLLDSEWESLAIGRRLSRALSNGEPLTLSDLGVAEVSQTQR